MPFFAESKCQIKSNQIKKAQVDGKKARAGRCVVLATAPNNLFDKKGTLSQFTSSTNSAMVGHEAYSIWFSGRVQNGSRDDDDFIAMTKKSQQGEKKRRKQKKKGKSMVPIKGRHRVQLEAGGMIGRVASSPG